ncbi:MAG: hypothetical protein A2W85_12275 [Bacteroidetes bacterium GWF2_41_31]|nr:MAG: hypothetical protein A2W85_12275 [Bacteroidetes bacterium GWF2_41_31]
MIQLIDRQEIFSKLSNISYEIVDLQNAFYDNSMEFDSQTEQQEYLDSFDALNVKFNKPATKSKLISFEHENLSTFPKVLGDKIWDLFHSIGQTDFYLISHLKLDLFGNLNNKYKPLVQSYNKLEKIVGAKTYYEALKIGIDDLKELSTIIFWITRCDMSSPEYIFFATADNRLSFNICKYGNIHLTEYGNIEIVNDKLMKRFGLYEITDEFERFSESGIIDGRRLKK